MARRSVYVIEVRSFGETKISQEGYDSYEKALDFIRSRYGDMKEISPYHFISNERSVCAGSNISRDYFIHEINIK